jgi:hypothetical protein
MNEPVGTRFTFSLLLTMLCIGLVLVAVSALNVGPRSLRDSEVALINGRPIERADFNQQARQIEVREPAGRGALLAYLITEQLLVQRAIEIGLLDSDPQLHRLVVRVTIDAAERQAMSADPDDTELRGFTRSRPTLSSTAHRWKVVGAILPGVAAGGSSAGLERVRAAVAAGYSFRSAVGREHGHLVDKIPKSPLTVEEVESYAGADVAGTLLQVDPAGIASYSMTDGRMYILRVEPDVPDAPLDWKDMRYVAMTDYQHQLASESLRRIRDEQCRISGVWVEINRQSIDICEITGGFERNAN